ncbi:MAG: Tetracycline resistance protein, class C [Anaerolineales bacterium]|nr:Tetracycline resistance protein, class C [Anaerolineales bacterium]
MRMDKSTGRRRPNLGEVVVATRAITSGPSPQRTRTIILLLAASVALMMTGFGIIMPVFARRLGEFGSGVEALGLMTMSFALAQFLAAPVMGSFADRFGRRPLVLVSLAAFAAANVGFLFAPSTEVFIAVRALEGALTAGLFPAAMGVVADVVPEDKRAQWIGIVMGSYGAGFIFGPVVGGVLYDGWGFAAPFVASAALAIIAFIAAAILVPETRTHELRRRETLRQRRAAAMAPAQERSFWASLPKPLYVFGTLLILDFIGVFAFAFVEPQMVFYFYEELNWSTVRFGVVVGVYGLAMVIGQAGLGQSSDRFGRKPIIILGILLTATFYAGLTVVTWFPLMLLVAIVAGLGAALTAPALSAFYLDITAEQHRSRVVGIKESAAALGGVAGPLLVVVASTVTTPQGVFVIAGALTLLAAGLALVALRSPRHSAEGTEDVAWECSSQRAMAAQAALRGVVLSAEARGKRVLWNSPARR